MGFNDVVTEPQSDFRSGFVTLVGRPNVGKSSLVNAICGAKVSIVSDKPQTTRHRVRGVYNRPEAQLVFVDTPGLHKPVTALGRRVNATAIDSVTESDQAVDVVCLVIDATAPFGSGDQWVADHLDLQHTVVVVNKTDRAKRDKVMLQLVAAGSLNAEAYFPVSARTGDGIDALVDHLVARAPEGPPMFPTDTVRDVPEEQWIAELVREQLLAVAVVLAALYPVVPVLLGLTVLRERLTGTQAAGLGLAGAAVGLIALAG